MAVNKWIFTFLHCCKNVEWTDFEINDCLIFVIVVIFIDAVLFLCSVCQRCPWLCMKSVSFTDKNANILTRTIGIHYIWCIQTTQTHIHQPSKVHIHNLYFHTEISVECSTIFCALLFVFFFRRWNFLLFSAVSIWHAYVAKWHRICICIG